jgi:ubiquinone biosynthesis monooxygenase Coq7
MKARALTPLDRVLVEIERALGSALDSRPIAQRPSPAEGIEDTVLSDEERRHAGGLMRINHVGEVCAQALYSGQAAVARSDSLAQPTARSGGGGNRSSGLVRGAPG